MSPAPVAVKVQASATCWPTDARAGIATSEASREAPFAATRLPKDRETTAPEVTESMAVAVAVKVAVPADATTPVQVNCTDPPAVSVPSDAGDGPVKGLRRPVPVFTSRNGTTLVAGTPPRLVTVNLSLTVSPFSAGEVSTRREVESITRLITTVTGSEVSRGWTTAEEFA
jgi:hypothetical protein